MKKELNILIACVLLWCAGIVISPILVSIHLVGEDAAHFLYRFYGVVCHQFDMRSFHLLGHPLAVCVRCTAIYFGFLFALIGIRFSAKLFNKQFNPIFVLIYSSAPMLLDVACSFTPIYQISTPSRLITGTIFGIGLALLLHRSLTETISSQLTSKFYETKTR
jgi:uncharacterized membrane protein